MRSLSLLWTALARSPNARRLKGQPSSRAGFTILELIVVVVIIGVLAALVFAKIQDVKDKSYVAAMKNDLHNYAMQAEIYHSSNPDGYPAGPASLTAFQFSPNVQLHAFQNSASSYIVEFQHAQSGKVCSLNIASGQTVCAVPGDDALPIGSSSSTIVPGGSVTFDASSALTGAGLSAQPTAALAGQAVGLTLNAAPASVNAGALDHVSWNYGDGTFDIGSVASLRTVNHTFVGDTKSYKVTFAATTLDGRVLTGHVLVSVANPTDSTAHQRGPATNNPSLWPTAAFTVSTATNRQYLPVAFDASGAAAAAGRTLANYGWDFGDGVRDTGRGIQHGYSTPGTYTVQLTVTDNVGDTNTVAHTVVIGLANHAPVAAIAFPRDTMTEADTVRLDGSGSSDPDGDPITYLWDVGDYSATFFNGSIASHQFLPGSYAVKLTVTDSGGLSTTITKTLVVAAKQPPVIDSITVSPNPTPQGVQPTLRAFAHDDGTITGYTWSEVKNSIQEFSATGATATYTNTASAGPKTVQLTVVDNGSKQTSATVTFTLAAKPTAHITGIPDTVIAGHTFAPNGSTSVADFGRTIASYAWGMGTGNAADNLTGATPVFGGYASTVTGTTVTLTITDDLNQTATASKVVTVITPPTANFTYAPFNQVYVGRQVTFDGTGSHANSGPGIARYVWDFGDFASDSAGDGSSHVFNAGGTSFNVWLHVRDQASQTDSATRSIYVRNLPTIPLFGALCDTVATAGIAMNCNGGGAAPDPRQGSLASWRWTWGDGTSNTVLGVTDPSAITHTFAVAATRTVSLLVTDDAGAAATRSGTVRVVASSPTVDYTIAPKAGMAMVAGDTIVFTGSVNFPTGATATKYVWDFGDGGLDSTTGTPVKHVYASGGSGAVGYSTSLTVRTNQGGSATATKQAGISPTPPAGAIAWFKGDQGVTVNGSTFVTRWADAGGTASRDYTQGTDASHLATVVSNAWNGHSVLQFNGAATGTALQTAFPVTSGDVTTFVVWSLEGSSANYQLPFFAAGNIYSIGTYAGSLTHYSTASGAVTGSYPPTTLGQPIISAVVTKAGAYDSVFANGYVVKGWNGNAAIPNGTMSIGNGYSGVGWSSAFQGRVGEVIIYNSAMNATQRGQVESYLRGKYGTGTAPTAAFSQTGSFMKDSTIAFNASASTDQDGISRYAWTFGDGAAGTGKTPVHAYGATGAYSVQLAVTNVWGLTSTTTRTVTISATTSGVPANPAAWYMADALGLSNNASVTAWPDQSANGRGLTPTGSTYPTFRTAQQNGLPAVRFNNDQDVLKAAGYSAVASTPMTAFIVWKDSAQSAPCTWRKTLTHAYANSGGPETLMAVCGSANYWASYNVNTVGVATAPWAVSTLVFSGSSAAGYYRNGAQVASSGNGDKGLMTIELGGDYSVQGGSTTNGNFIGEVLLYNRVLTTAERQQAEAYLRGKWGTP